MAVPDLLQHKQCFAMGCCKQSKLDPHQSHRLAKGTAVHVSIHVLYDVTEHGNRPEKSRQVDSVELIQV